MRNLNRNTQQLSDRHIGSLTCGVRAFMVEKALELPLPMKILNQNNIAFLEGLQTLVLPSRAWKMPTTSPFNSPIWLLQKMYLVRMTVDYHKFNQVLTPIANLSDFISLLEQINTSPGMWYAAVDWANAFFSMSTSIDHPCFQLARPAKYPHCPTSGVYQLSSLML